MKSVSSILRISFLDILDKDNREYLKMYVKYQLGVTGLSVQNIWGRVYITKAFLRFLDREELKVEKLTAAEIDQYMRLLQRQNGDEKIVSILYNLPGCLQMELFRY